MSAYREGNPVTGDVDEVRSYADHYQGVSEALQRLTVQLRTIASGESQGAGRAVEAVEGRLATLAGAMQQVSVRYSGMADEVGRFSGTLLSLQGEGNRLVENRDEHAEMLRQVQRDIEQAEVQAATPAPDQAEAVARLEGLRRTEGELHGALAHLDGQLEQLRVEYEQAAWRLYWSLDSSMKNSNLADAWGADFVRALVDVLDVVVRVLQIVALIVTILVAVVCFIASVFFPALAAVGAALLLAAKVIAIAIFVIEVVRFALTEFDVVAFVVAFVGAVLSVVGGALLEALGKAIGKLLSLALAKALGQVLAAAAAQTVSTAFVEGMKAGLGVVVDAIVGLGGDKARAYFEALSSAGGVVFAPQLDELGAAVYDEVVDAGADFSEALGDVLGDAVGDVATGAEALAAPALQALGELRQGAVDVLGARTVDALEEFAGDVISGKDPLDAGRDLALGLGAEWGEDLMQQFDLDGWLDSTFGDAGSALDEALDAFFDAAGAAGGDAAGRLGDAARGVLGDAGLGALGDAAADALGGSGFDALGDAATAALGDIASDALGASGAAELLDGARALQGGDPLPWPPELSGGDPSGALGALFGDGFEAEVSDLGRQIAEAARDPEVVVSRLVGAAARGMGGAGDDD